MSDLNFDDYEEFSLPVRLRRALEGLVKADIVSEAQMARLIADAQQRSNVADPEKGQQNWVDILWDQVTVLRAEAEARKAKTDPSRKNRRQRQK